MHGFSPRNLKYMRRFAEIWPDEVIVQRCVAQLQWRHNICPMEKVKEANRQLNHGNSSNHYSVRPFCGLKNDQENRPLDHDGFPVKSTFTESLCVAELFKLYQILTK